MPECIFLELLGPAEFGIAVSEDRIEFQFSGSNETVPDPLYWDPDADFNTYCMFDTHKPLCADYSGILRSRTQHNIACKEVEPELSCLEIMYEAHCEGKSDPCGEKKVTRDLMKCCAKSYNDPGSGCLSRRRRRLNEAVEMAVITDVEAATQCAESCFRRAMGPSASVADACVAWRLEDNGACVLSNGCYFAEAADLLLLDRKLWNTIEGVDMFKGARAPAPKRVRRVKDE